MAVFINAEKQQFHLTNGQVSYIFHVMKNGHLGSLYYGKAVRDREDFSHFQDYGNPVPNSSHIYKEDPAFSLEAVKQEFPVYGKTDFREPAVSIKTIEGSHITDFKFKGYKVLEGKPELEGLPSTYVDDRGEATTLQIFLEDKNLGAELTLNYTIFRDHAVITRSSSLRNNGSEKFFIERLMSTSIDFNHKNFIMHQLSGAWTRERHVIERRLEHGIQSVSSARGASSHQHNPFLALQSLSADEHQGEVYAFNFVYSGNFLAQAEVDHYEQTRVSMGIHPFRFEWKLEPEETFQSPEAVLVFSDEGLNGMSRIFHQFYQRHLIPPYWREKTRPVLINNWEATYHDFDADTLERIAASASELGVELFVLDDGWFGKRNDDTSSLGDWDENREKLPDGLDGLAEKIRGTGLQFGLWFEPEMVSQDSRLFEEHPDWIIGKPGEHFSYGRNQLVLDFSRQEIVEYMYGKMAQIIRKAKLSYIKWDMNRSITEAYSRSLNAENQGKFFHKYMLGVYSLYEKLTAEFPEVLFESCAGGGGRFDPGMFRYAPQAWASDNTDAVERLKIQYGTSYAYPLYSIGSHVSAVPNHQTLRETSLEMRGNTAYFGTFGYELNPLEMSEAEREEVKEQIIFYKKHRELIRDGVFRRLKSPFQGNETAWIVSAKDGSEALAGWYKVLAEPNPNKEQTLRLKGLDPSAEYMLDGSGVTYFGDELMNRGLNLSREFNGANGAQAERGGDFQSQVFYLKKIN
jgi:alpha-galactosidase